MSSKKKHSGTTLPSKRARKSYKQVEPVLRPLLELFAVVDDVFTEPDAFDKGTIEKSLGRIYREWRDSTRPSLDPEFDRERYRHDIKGRSKKKTSPLGRSPLASGSPTSSTDPRKTSGKSRSKSGGQGKRHAKRSA